MAPRRAPRSQRLNRRAFLGKTALLSGVWPLLQSGPALPGRSADSARLFELGTVTYNLGRNWGLDRLIEICEETNFKAVELRTTHAHGVEPTLSKRQRAAVRRRFQKTPVQLAGLGTVCEFHSPDANAVRHNIQIAREFIELAADVGAAGVKVRPNGIPEGVRVETTLQQIGHALQEVAQTAEKHQVEVWLEVHGRGSSHPPHIRRIMDYCRHPLVGVTWNSNPTDLKEGSVQPYFDLLKNHVRNVHLHELSSDYPYEELFTLLRSLGYEGWTMAEVGEAKGDPVRFMRYYRRLWEVLSNPGG